MFLFRKFFLKIVLILFLSVNYVFAFPQTEYIFEHIDKSDGLSQGTVNAIFEDNDGLMWFGTNDGLNRYDGKKMLVFRRDHKNPNSLPNNNILSINQDREGRLWVGTMGSGLYFMDPITKEFKSYKELVFDSAQKFIGAHIYCLAIHQKTNTLWVGSNIGVTSISLDTGDLTFIDLTSNPVDGLLAGSVFSILVDDDRVLIGTDFGGLLQYNLLTGQLISIPIEGMKQTDEWKRHRGTVFQVVRASNKEIWVSVYGKSLLKFDEKTQTLIYVPFINSINKTYYYPYSMAVALVGDTALWCATTGNGLQIINLNKRTVAGIKYDAGNQGGITSNTLKTVFCDRNGGVWVGDYGLGINYYFPVNKNFKHLSRSTTGRSGLTFQSVRSIYRDEQKRLWVGGYGGLNIFNQKKELIFNNSKIDNAYFIYPDQYNQNVVWIASEGGGVRKFRKSDGLVLDQYILRQNPSKEGIIGYSVFSILQKSKNELYLGTETALNIFNIETAVSEGIAHDPEDPFSLPKGKIRALYKDSKSRVWVGTLGGGLGYFFGEDEPFYNFQHQDSNPTSISSNIIYSVFESKSGFLYIGTDYGLNIFNETDQSFNVLTTADGLINDVVYGILEDDEGQLWLSTNEGISCFNPASGTFRNYDLEDGLQANEFNSGAYYEDDEHTFYFGGVNGLSIFRPNELMNNQIAPKVVFTELFIGNEVAVIDPPITKSAQVHLDFSNQAFRLEFAALNYYKPRKNQYAYRIKEIREAWTFLGNQNSIEIANLGHGTFTIEVIAANNDGIWNPDKARLSVIIDPPFWATNWFLILFVLGGALFLSLFFLYRIQILRNNKLKLERLVSERTSELSNMNKALQEEIAIRKNTEHELLIANQTKDRFFSIIAHDLRNPFNILLGVTDILIADFDHMKRDQQKELLNMLESSSQQLYELLENLLSWSISQRSKMILNPEELNVAEWIGHMVAFALPQAKKKNINLHYRVPEDLIIKIDKNSMNTVLRNLITNALKFTHPSGSVVVSAEDREAHIAIIIQDTGVGISKQNLENLFKIDEMNVSIGTANEKGTGLGLALCYDFVRFNGGTISVESNLGKGTIFTILFPKEAE